MHSSKSALLAMAALMAGASLPAGMQVTATAPNAPGVQQADGKTGAKQTQRAVDSERSNYGISGPGPAWRVGRRTFPGGGWSVRQGQRMARKARNQQRHKAATRG